MLVSFSIGPKGEIKNVTVVKSTNRVFNRHSVNTVAQFKCQGQGKDVHGITVPLIFNTQ